MVHPTGMSKIPAILLALIMGVQPSLSYARDGDHDSGKDKDRGRHEERHHYYHYHDRPSFGLQLSFFPDDAYVVGVGAGTYYYYDGLYYTRRGPDVVLVNPPIGAVVTSIPAEFQPVVINGVTYYVDNGTYYVYTRNGYQLVPQPVAVMPAPPVVVAQQAPAVAATVVAADPVVDQEFTVNIPNVKSSGYTPVLIKRSGAGFIGPQGEFYPEFPKVAQLQVMYAK